MVFGTSSSSSSNGSIRESCASKTFSERKYEVEGREFNLASLFLFAEDPITREVRQREKDNTDVSKWCKKNGYKDVITPKKTYHTNATATTKFALHTAVKQQDLEMVRLLIRCGATKDAINSNGMTPSQLAELMDPSVTRDQILFALRM
eukprot:CAMPEP_0169147768 /NCGR_PEP_ID=MMETSP1015-20121227/48432_1 /TAXON_ID=342587 /ORGANISM="Karlodinium micrum, Strain CCMP2283" /LENGTH=148 /DNA_ID=CAMNT_0009216069 /DNA_START=39 /DNA_END=485 /DNA_ORIENTATION=+